MRKFMTVLAIACVIVTMGEARADRIHLPCDASMGVTLGTGTFDGHTRSSGYGDISFTRMQPSYLRLEGTAFGNCTEDDGDPDRNPKVSRRWFGRLNVHGALALETSSLGFENEPQKKFNKEGQPIWLLDKDGNPILDEEGDKVQATKNGLLKADLETDKDFAWSAGLRLSIYDHPHFHLEAFGEYSGTLGWNPASAEIVVARVLELNLDVTDLVQDFARLRYRWDMVHVGLTVAVPLRPNTVDRWRVTPFVSAGRMRFRADAGMNVDPDLVSSLEALKVDVADLTQVRSIRKDSWLAYTGARVDLNSRYSAEAAAAFWKSDSTTVYWISVSGTIRFSYPWE